MGAKKILFVTSDEYPLNGANTNILKALFDVETFLSGFDFFVLSKKPSEPIERETNNIWYVEPNSSNNFLKIENHKTKVGVFFIKILRVIYWFLHRRQLCNKKLVHAVYSQLKKSRYLKFDLVITLLGGKFYESAAVIKFSKKYKIPFVLYQLDPCMNNECEGPDNQKARVKLEKGLYKKASLILTTQIIFNIHKKDSLSKFLFKTYVMEFPLVSNKTTKPIQKDNTNIITCLYTGSLYYPIRLPYYTIKLFENIFVDERIQLLFIGKNCQSFQDSDTSCDVLWQPTISRLKLDSFFESADFLINIGNSIKNQIPSKIFDYISLGKPIINICKFADCPSLKYLSKYPLALNLVEDENMLDWNANRLSEFLEKHRRSRVSYSEIEKVFKKCTASFCANYFTNLIKEVIKKD